MKDSNKSSGIESESLLAVNSLRSKFEQLAGADSISRSRAAPGTVANGVHLHPTHSPRPRTPSGTLQPRPYSPSPVISTLLASDSDSSLSPTKHVRQSSSASDLKGMLRRPPPPPPLLAHSRSPIIRTPSPSSLLLSRPVPPPGAMPDSVPSTPTIPSQSARGLPIESAHGAIESPSLNFASLRDKFASQHISPPVPPPRSKHHPNESVSSESLIDISSPEADPCTLSKSRIKPSIPPRRNVPPTPGSRSASASSLSSSMERSPFSQSDSDSESSYSPPASISATPPCLPSRASILPHSEPDLLNILHHPTPPPRPPPRHLNTDVITSGAGPPPLPQRRAAAIVTDAIPNPGAAPLLPIRPAVFISPTAMHPEETLATPTTERRFIGSHKHPPPPTRQLGAKAPVPPARPQTPPQIGAASNEDSESSEEDDDTQDYMPDKSHSSRRPPLLFPPPTPGADPRIHVPAYTGHVAISSPIVVMASGHHAKVYSLPTISGSSGLNFMHQHNYCTPEAIMDIDTKSFGLRDAPKLSSVEFRYCCRLEDRGKLIWLGTKDGHLIEVDIRTGKARGMKLSALSSVVTHIWRRKSNMIVVDENGKVLIFDLESSSPDEDVRLTQSAPIPKVMRINEKADFVGIAGGRVWAACRSETQGSATSHSRIPIIRVYDVLNPASRIVTVLPTQPVGAVTGATELDGGRVFLTHEAGFVTIWSLLPDSEEPLCTDVVRVGMSDLTSCLGVCGRLWIGGRAGMINVYDVSQKPWVATNSWFAHERDLPVIKLKADLSAVERSDPQGQRWAGLGVLSVGRDEIMRFWDGMLGQEWIDLELTKHEAQFSKLRKIKILVVSWNCDAARPEDLTGNAANITLLSDMLASVDSPDIISFGFQEVIDLESRKLAAKNVFMNNKRIHDRRAAATSPNDDSGRVVIGGGGGQGLSDNVTRAYKRWHERLRSAVRTAMPANCPYEVVHTESMIGLFTCVFVKSKDKVLLRDAAINTVKRGMGGRYGNKGGIMARFVIEDSSICLINCHLAAGQSHTRQRNADIASFLEARDLFPASSEQLAYSGGGDGTMILDHEIVILNGDLNYRIDQRRENAVTPIMSGDYEALYGHDQLLKEMKFNRGFRLRGFSEGPLAFAPTYKYDRRSTEYDTSEKSRVPAWCDRVLWKASVQERVRQLHYQRYEADVSDHRPISAAFEVVVKSVRHEVRQAVKDEVELLWKEEQKKIFRREKEFCLRIGLI